MGLAHMCRRHGLLRSRSLAPAGAQTGARWREAGAARPAATPRPPRRRRPCSRVTGSTWPRTGSRPRRASSSARPRSWSASARSARPRLGPPRSCRSTRPPGTRAPPPCASSSTAITAAANSCSSTVATGRTSPTTGSTTSCRRTSSAPVTPTWPSTSTAVGAFYPGPTRAVDGRAVAVLRMGQPHLLPLHGLGLLRTRLPQRPRPWGNVKRPASEPAASAFPLTNFAV